MKTANNLSPKDSISIIQEMIEIAKGNIRSRAYYFIIWGYAVLAGCLLHYALLKLTDYEKPYQAWLIVLLGFIPATIYSIKQAKSEKIFTHLDRINVFLWVTFGVSYLIFLVYIAKFNYQIFPLIFLLVGNCVFMSGINLKFKPLIAGGILYWVGTIISFYLSLEYLLLLCFVLIIVGYLIPGYMLKNKKESDV
ncbi:hypothetical protein ES705_11804 [subsurface metagenome]